MSPVRIAGIVLASLALLLAGFLLIGVLLPSGWSTERSAILPAPPDVAFDFLERPAEWESWTPSPESGFEYFGPDRGEGAGRRWDDSGYGHGEFRITESLPPNELRYQVDVEGGAIRIHGHFLLEESGDEETRVVWREEGDFGWNPLLGYLAGRMEELQGAQLEASLALLQQALLTAARNGDQREAEASATAPPD